MSHELRTPLNAIIGYSELLQEEAQDQGDTYLIIDLEKIRAAGNHLLAIISDILDLSKIEAGKMALHLEDFDLEDLIQEVVTTSRPLATKNDNSLQANYPDDIGSMYADRVKVQQILLNLLNNAAKFTSSGRITLSANRTSVDEDHWIHFTVSDTGIGMTQDQMRSLFQPFTQVNAAITREYGGTGLGLSISESFCRLMGGEIEVESEPGAGSTFTVRLPEVVTSKPQQLGDEAGILTVADSPEMVR
jgi:signal transduction histidine kinase